MASEEIDKIVDNLLEDEPSNGKKKTPRYQMVYCSQCGEGFGPGDHGFSHCESHKGMKPVED